MLAIAMACGGDDDDAGETGDDGGSSGGGTEPTKASGGGSSSGDTGAAAAPGTGRFEVGGKTYTLAITECKFNDEGPSKGTFEVKATADGGAKFDMTQFYLNDKWSQTDVQLDVSPTSKIYVIRGRSSAGAEPAKVDGKNITWVEKFRDLDGPANTQKDVGEGKLNLTCQ
jgi:hypothetical protein